MIALRDITGLSSGKQSWGLEGGCMRRDGQMRRPSQKTGRAVRWSCGSGAGHRMHPCGARGDGARGHGHLVALCSRNRLPCHEGERRRGDVTGSGCATAPNPPLAFMSSSFPS